jgi:hypothetical protein
MAEKISRDKRQKNVSKHVSNIKAAIKSSS